MTISTFEKALERASDGLLPPQSVLWVLAATDLVVPTTEHYNGELGRLRPLLLAREGVTYLAVFTRPEFLDSKYHETAPAFITLSGRDILNSI